MSATSTRSDRSHAARRWWVGVWLLLLAICAAAVWYVVAVFVPHERAAAIEVWRGRLSAMADDRKAAITAWLDERRGDARVVAEDPTALYLLSGRRTEPYLFAPEDGPQRHVQRLLDSVQGAYGYRAVYVLDAGGNVVVDSTGSPPLEPTCRASIARVVSSGHPEVDLHAHADGLPVLAITAPVRAGDRTVGAVLLSVDPGRWLYPLLRAEPFPTRTGESLLARRFGDEVEFLSPLRHRFVPPLSFRLPMALPLVAVAAIRGEEGFRPYVDYRGVRVLGAARRIPGTGWGLVVKVDEDEALAGFRRNVRQVALAWACVLLALAGLGFGGQRALAARHRRELGESEARFALLRDHANDAILFAGRDGVILDVNRRAEELYGRRREELIGLPLDELRAPEERAALRHRLDALTPDGQIVFEAVHLRPDGSRFPVEVSTRVADLAGQDVLVSIVRDITERKSAEEALRESEDRFRYVFEHSILGKSLTRPTGEIQVNSAFAEMLGYSLAEMTAKRWQEITHPDDVADTQRVVDLLLSGEREFARFTKRYIHKNGSVVWADVATSLRRDKTSAPLYLMTSVNDITERKKKEAELAAAQQLYRELFENVNVGILRSAPGPQGAFIDVNPAMVRMFEADSREQLMALHPSEIYWDESQRKIVSDAIVAKGRVEEEVRFKTLKGKLIWCHINAVRKIDAGGRIYFDNTIEDITERKRAEERIATLNRLLRTISEVNQLIVRERDRDRLLAEACRIVVEHGGFRMAWIGFTDETTGTVVPATWAGFEDGYLGGISARFDDTPSGRGPTGTAIREGRVVVANDWETDERLAPWREAARARGYRSSASLPLSAGGKVTGALSVYAAETAAFDAEVTDLLGELAGDIAFALEAMNATARREAAERSLAGSEERFRIASETSNDVVYEWDLKQSIQWFGNIDEILGYSPGEFPRTLDGWAASVHPDDLERVMAAVRAHLEEHVPYAIEYRVRKQDGAYRWWTARGAATRTPDGNPVRWVGTITDITERKRDEEALRESEAKYRTLVENIPQKIFMKDRSFRFVSINEKFAHDFGLRPEEVVGKMDGDFFPPELAAKYHEDDVRILETGKTEELEEKYVQEGRETWVNTVKTPVRDANGEIVGVLGVFWDITDRKRAEEALNESEERFRSLYENSTVGLYRTTPDGRILMANPTLVDMLGHASFDELASKSLKDDGFQPSDLRAPFLEAIERDGEVMGREAAWMRADGSVVFIRESARAIRDSQGNTLYYDGSVENITERKRAEEALKASEALLQAAVNILPVGLWIIDAEGKIVTSSAAAQRIWAGVRYVGIDQLGEYKGWRTDSGKLIEAHEWAGARALEKGETTIEEEVEIECFDGTHKIILDSAVPLRKSDGSIGGAVTINQDVTDRKRAEEEIRRLNAELEQRVVERTAQLETANKELEAFSYSVSHDLRAPLRAIDGFSRIVVDDYGDRLDDEGKRQLEVIRANTHKMGRLIDDLLAFSRAGRAELHHALVKMAPLVQVAFAEVVPSPEEQVRIDFAADDLPDAWADLALIRQVWVNLLSNAVKFSRPRERAVIRVTGAHEGGRVVFHVSDNGVGFDMKYVDKLFGVFQRLHSSREFEGTGVGLALVQRIIRRHGGELWAEGVEDGGATFSFALPEEGSHEQQ